MKPFKAIAAMPKPVLLGGLFIILATLAAYWPVFSAGFIWDDDAYVTDNPLLTAPDGLSSIWFSAHSQSQYFPLVFSTLRLEYALWGLNPVGYHVVNVGLHIVNSLLVWALLRRLALPRAWLAAAVFALHPVQVETVAWVTELKNTESTLFYLLAVFAWLDFCAGKGRWFYALALALHALALFAKTTACTLPAVLLLVLWLKNEPVNWRRIFQVLPFLLLGFGMGLLSVWWENHLGNNLPKFHLLGGPLERPLGNPRRRLAAIPLAGGLPGRGDGALVQAAQAGARAGGGADLFCHRAVADAGIHSALHILFFVCGRPLSISCLPWPDYFGPRPRGKVF
jgi:hypothetical protein